MAKNFIPIFLGDIIADWNAACAWYEESHPNRNSNPPKLQIDDDPVRLKGQYLGCLISRFQMKTLLASLKEYPRPNVIPAGGDMNYVGWSMDLFTRTKNEKRISIYPLDENQATDSERSEERKSSDDFIESFLSYLRIPAGAEKDHRVQHCRVIAQHFDSNLIAEIPEEKQPVALAMLKGEEGLFDLLPVTKFGNPYPAGYVSTPKGRPWPNEIVVGDAIDDGLTIPEFVPVDVSGAQEILAILEDAKTKIAKAFGIALKDMT